MAYLVCDKCGGLYELQPGEKTENFDLKCECGGKIKYKESIEVDNQSKYFDKSFNVWKRVIGILSGAIIIILISAILNVELVRFAVLYSSGPLTLTYLLTLVFAGIVVVFIARGSYKECIFNCVAAGLIGGAWVSIFNGYMPSSFGFIVILMSVFLSFLGGLTAIMMIKLKK